MNKNNYIRWFEDVTVADIASVGGKNASLGEMIQRLAGTGVHVPEGFATTAAAFREFIHSNQLHDKIEGILARKKEGAFTLQQAGWQIRSLIKRGAFPPNMAAAIINAYHALSGRYGVEAADVAVRSSATAEDLPQASFAGQQETFLNIRGENDLLDACRNCFASLFTDRAITYREEQGFDHMAVALSVGVQKMVRSDLAGAGVMFTLDTETGFPDVIVINAAWGLGENVVKGAINPDEYEVFKPLLSHGRARPIIHKHIGAKEKKMIYATGGSQSIKNVPTTEDERRTSVLTDDEILQLAHWGCTIESHYDQPMDIEWAKDGETAELFIVQARPETIQSQRAENLLQTFYLAEQGERLLTGMAIGEAIATGEACVVRSAAEIADFRPGSILVTGITDPDWVPIMKQAAGIVTDYGGRTSHAAIVSRELGIPAIVGTGEATHLLTDGQPITLSCAEGERGFVYDGILAYRTETVDLTAVPETNTRLMLNIASPEAAFRWWRLPAQGIGLARMEFIINNTIKIHPLALVHFAELPASAEKRQMAALTAGYANKSDYFVDHLARGIAKIAAAQYPHPVIVRMSDFKTNEYAGLIGGRQFEPEEENPMLGFRGASRYYSEQYRAGFALECAAVKKVREEIGLDNVIVMIPFCRTLEEADRVLVEMSLNGLQRGENGLKVYVMAEIPANIILAEDFAERFDGFSIGSNDLTQLVLGVDRDSGLLSALFDERDAAVKQMILDLIERAHAVGRPVGICGQAPSDYPEFAAFLVGAGIDSISLNPDSLVNTAAEIAHEEKLRTAVVPF